MQALAHELTTYLGADDIREIERAYDFGEAAHSGQQRKNGDPYIAHPLAVAQILGQMRVDRSTLVAAILHDVLEDTQHGRDELAAQFGEEVATLVDGVSKLTHLSFETREDAQAANFRKMLLAMSRDLRVILIKLADRLHNMRTIHYLARDKRRRIARETLDIYAPIAQRLGMHTFRLELEDLGFAALYPMRYRVINESVRRARGNRRDLVTRIEAALHQGLDAEGIAHRIVSREKHVYSIYQKMRSQGSSFHDVHDVYGMRVIVDAVDTCYRALGIAHSVFKPVPGRFKDYIAIPKVNGYQSLHTALMTPFQVPVEVQIRTEEMDRVANDGVAAHWLYKSGESGHSGHQRAREWLQELLELQKGGGDSKEFLDHVKIDLFPDEVYVFTPKGDIMKLPAGATVIDFAYAVHTDVGNHCVAARVNKQLTPLSTALESGSTIEIITAATATPHPLWLEFAQTAKARARVRHFLKDLQRGKAQELGSRLLERELAKFDARLESIPDSRKQAVMEEFKVETLEQLLEDIGLGQRMALVVARHLVSDAPTAPVARSGLRRAISRVAPSLFGEGPDQREPLTIKGTEGMVLSYARCCRPIPGDPIRGFVTSGRGMVIHVDDCPNVAEYRKQPDRWLDVYWDEQIERHFPVEIRVMVANQRGQLAVLAAAVAEGNANIDQVNVENHDGYHAVATFTLEVRNRVHLAQIMKRLRKNPHVTRITRKKG